MLHGLSSTASAVSLLLFAATVLEWVRTYRGSPVWWWIIADSHHELLLDIQSGSLFLEYLPKPEVQLLSNPPTHELVPHCLVACGFSAIETFWRVDIVGGYEVTVPLWAIVSISAVLPVAWIARRVRSFHACRTGCCAVCGYDLRASKERCPECGTSIDG